MQPAHDDGITHIDRLEPGKVDIVLGSARRPAPPARGGWGRWGLLALAVAGAAWYVQRTPAPVTPPAVAEYADEQANPPEALDDALPAASNHSFAPIETTPKPYEAPPPAPAKAAPSGLVSQAYLDQLRNRPQHNNRARPYREMAATIPGLRGNRYQATWRIYDGEIDGDSVCANFASGSGERMDCRAAAQRFFEEQCKSWSQRAEGSRDEVVRASKAQYCGVRL